MTSFRSDIEGSVLLQHQYDLYVVVNNYDEVLRSLLDKQAPVKERVVTVRPSAPWHTAEVTAEKQKRRQLERKWRASRLPADREQYVQQSNVVINLIKSRKSEHYSFIIKENSGNQNVLFKTVQKLLQKPTVNYYPPSENDRMLADEFATFFLLLRLIHYIKISLLKRRLLLIRPNVLLMRYSLYLRLNFQLLLRWNLMTSGNWLQHCSRSPVSWIHYHLLSSNNVQTYCCLLFLTSSTSLFVKAACLRV